MYNTMTFMHGQKLCLKTNVNRMMMQVRDGKALTGRYDEPISH